LIVHPVNHATFVMSWAGKLIYVDPVGGAERFEGLPAPDVIFVTDIHGDHLNADTLTAIVQAETVIVAPQAVHDALPAALQGATQVLANGGTLTVQDIAVEAIPMYNLTAERLQYHTKGRGNGYVLTVGGKRVYIAGDTEDIPEMRQLRDIDIAFIPMNLPFTMTVEQAADAVREFKPKVVYPYHSRGSDLDEFTRLVGTDVGVEVRVRAWY
jgi:L-ascorbate metabolism protein UlaG (beta-lactamase superfamily)